MLMADTMSIFFVILGMMLAFPGLWLLCRGLWPETVASTCDRCSRGFWSSFLAGLPVTIAMILLTRILLSSLGPAGKIAGVTLVCLYLLQAHAGVAGLATAIGCRLGSPVDKDRPWRATMRGGIVLELAYLLPILGWFGILPASIVIGSGAANLALLTKLKRALFHRRQESPATVVGESEAAVSGQIGGPIGAA